MSGIAGLYYLDDRPVDRDGLDRMSAAIAHRGPDREGLWLDGPIGLAHRMLWTTPESLGEVLPAVGGGGNLAITADARIDNRREVAGLLGLTDHQTAALADSELILRAYQKWQDRCVERLVGDFVFAIWDKVERRLFCARDHMGIKPFYYHCSARGFFFASEIKALLALPEVPREVNEVRVADYLAYLTEDKESTFYQDIFRLPPAHRLYVDQRELRIERYWRLDPSRNVRFGSDGEYEEAYRSVLGEAVHCRLRSAYPVGSLLSGGLDSSTLVAAAREIVDSEGKGPLATFSAVFDELPECDERQFVEQLVAQGGIDPHYVPADGLDFFADLDERLLEQDEPFFTWLNLYGLLHPRAAQSGCRALLDGFGGDQVVSYGLERLRDLAVSGRWGALRAEVKQLAANYKVRPRDILWRHVIKPMTPRWASGAWRAASRKSFAAGEPLQLIRGDFGHRIRFSQRVADLRAGARRGRTQRQAHLTMLEAGLNVVVFEELDRGAAAAGVEPRYPFFDKRVVELCLALPGEQKLLGGWPRSIACRSFAGRLPPAISWRTHKTDFSTAFIRGLRPGDLSAVEAGLLRDDVLLRFVDAARLRRAFGKRHQTGVANARVLTRVAALSRWLQQARRPRAVISETTHGPCFASGPNRMVPAGPGV